MQRESNYIKIKYLNLDTVTQVKKSLQFFNAVSTHDFISVDPGG